VVKEYVGTGPVAEATAQLDEEVRWRRQEETEAWKEEMRRMEALEAPIEELCDAAETLARAALVAAGYRQHNRGEWRLRRGDGQR
jgi:5-enolpyruvylshikimate-3-phosphate synthase